MVEIAPSPSRYRFDSLDLDRLGATAHGVATRLIGRRHPVDDGGADLRADLILAALERWPKFDPSRGRPMAFLAIAMTRAGTSIFRAQHAAKRGGRSTTVPLDDAMAAGHGRYPSLSVGIPDRPAGSRTRRPRRDRRPARGPCGTVCNSFLEAATDGRRRPSLGAAASAALRRHFESVGFSEHMS